MPHLTLERLEDRRLLSATALVPGVDTPVPNAAALAPSDVRTILAQAISQSANRQGDSTQAAVVVDREGTVLGILVAGGAIANQTAPQVVLDALVRARTAAYFESNGEAFTTRTARFIVQNHFPPAIANTEGGPLYGVEFSDLIGSDILAPSLTPAVSGDPGGVPLYMNGVAVGGIGVAGDGRDIAATAALIGVTRDLVSSLDNHLYNANPHGHAYNGNEETDRDEAVALAGAKGYMAPQSIRANNIFIGGLRLPFAAEPPAHGRTSQSFDNLLASGAAAEYAPAAGTFSAVPVGTTNIIAGEPEMQNATFAGVSGLIRDRANVEMSDTPGVPTLDTLGNTIPHADPQSSDDIVASSDPNGLTLDDVTTVISQAVHEASITRAGIRKPNGVNAEVHVVVVDVSGNVLGAFRMNDGTNFSYDVAVQKARTAAFFSDDSHAFSTRAIGFMSQRNFPPGLSSQAKGPLFGLQNNLDGFPDNPLTLKQPTPPGLGDGITIFPGGFPLYKNGKLVGAVGVSGDGVDQDDLISYSGAAGFEPPANIRSDDLPAAQITSFILSKIQEIEATTPLGYDAVAQARQSLAADLTKTRLPYAKFPRNPGVNGR